MTAETVCAVCARTGDGHAGLLHGFTAARTSLERAQVAEYQRLYQIHKAEARERERLYQWKRRAGRTKGLTRCGLCGGLGHNRRTCAAVLS